MLRLVLTAAALMVPFAAPGAGPAPRVPGVRSPEGWGVRLAAAEPLVVNPVTMTFGDDGRLYVAEWEAGRGPNDHIKVLTDDDGDGTFDRAGVFMGGLDLPAGILFWDGWVYLTLDHDVVRFRDRDGDGRFEDRQVIATGFGNDDSHHRVSGMSLGPDGWLYLTTGDSDARARGSDGSTATVLRSGGVFRCRPDGSKMENVAFGMRNPWGNVAFDDAFHLVHTDNDNEGSPGFTGCRLLHVVDGGDYGWRLREGARCCAPDFERATWDGGRPGRLGWMAETGRGAPAGLCVLNSGAFPDRFRNLVVYPDVFRKSVRAYRLEHRGATFQAAGGFELLGSDEGLFRPTDAEVGPDGALYVLDWRTDSGGAGQLSGNGKTGRIYRLTWDGTPAEPALPALPRDRLPKLRASGVDALLNTLKSPEALDRNAAARELIRRGRDAVPLRRLDDLLHGQGPPSSARLHALGVLWALHAEAPGFRRALAPALVDASAEVRRYAFELLGRTELPGDDADRPLAALALRAVREGDDRDDPEVRRAAAAALGRFGRLASRDEDGPDPERSAVERARRVAGAAARPGPDFPRDGWPLDRQPGALGGLSAGAIAGELLRVAAAETTSDPFLRDGVTRGLERLGPSGVERVARFVESSDPRFSGAAVFSLQGFRGDGTRAALLDAATSAEGFVSDDARGGLFLALREQADDVPPGPVVLWLNGHPKAAAGTRARAIRLLSAMHRRAALDAGPSLPGWLAGPDPEVRAAALGLSREVRSGAARDALVAVVRSADRPAGERTQALAALRSYDGLDLAPLAREVFPKAVDPGLRLELIRSLARSDPAGAAGLAEGLLGSPDRELRHEAIALLGARPESAAVVARRYLTGGLPPEDLSRVIEAVRSHATPELQESLQALLGKTMLAAPTGDEARRLREFVGRHGNPSRGKAVYLDPKKGGCATCHRLEGSGGAVGPDLTRVWETLSFDKRLESILEPSREIKEGFGTFKVATNDGRVVTGLLLADTPEGVTLKDAEGRERRIPAGEVEAKGFDKTSLMPVGVVGHLSLNDLADLLAFLGDRQAQESLRAASPPK